MHHNNFGNFYTREIYAIPIPIGFIPISIPIMSRMAIPILMGFPWGFPLPCTPLGETFCGIKHACVYALSSKRERSVSGGCSLLKLIVFVLHVFILNNGISPHSSCYVDSYRLMCLASIPSVRYISCLGDPVYSHVPAIFRLSLRLS